MRNKPEKIHVNHTSSIKKYGPYLLLILIIFVGLRLRVYHIGYPAIGYHNMKEVEFLAEAKVMYDTNDFLQTKVLWQGLQENDNIQESSPIIAWITAISWKIFGVHIILPRLFILGCFLGSIFLVYLIAKKLSGSEYFSLLAAFIMAILPLGVFFGRNIQPESPALFTILLAQYFFLIWTDSGKTRDFFWFSLAAAISALFKITNLIGLIPLLPFLPYKDMIKNYRKYLLPALIFFLMMLSVPLWALVSYHVSPTGYGVWEAGGNSLLEAFTADYWKNYGSIIKSYAIQENFTIWYFWFATIGSVFAIIHYKSKLSKYMLGYLVALIPYIAILSGRFHMHNYYQMPFIHLIAFLSAFFIFTLASFAKQAAKMFTGSKTIATIAMLVPLLLIIPTLDNVKTSVNRQFDMQYIGYDAAGEYIKNHSGPDERIFLEGISGGQGASLFWHAQRYGAWMPGNVSEVQRGERDKNFRWVVLYNEIWRYGKDEGIFYIASKPDVWEYIQKNYQIKQIGFVGDESKPLRIFYVLEKGGMINESSDFRIGPQKTYELTSGNIILNTAEGQ